MQQTPSRQDFCHIVIAWRRLQTALSANSSGCPGCSTTSSLMADGLLAMTLAAVPAIERQVPPPGRE